MRCCHDARVMENEGVRGVTHGKLGSGVRGVMYGEREGLKEGDSFLGNGELDNDRGQGQWKKTSVVRTNSERRPPRQGRENRKGHQAQLRSCLGPQQEASVCI